MNKALEIMGTNFAAGSIGPLDQLSTHVFCVPEIGLKTAGKVFLKRMLHLTSAEISLNRLPAHFEFPFVHKHRDNEEIYLFLRGFGEFAVDGEKFAVTEGSVVRVSPEGHRWLRNLGSEPLSYIVIQARAGSYGDHDTVSDGVVVGKLQP